MLPPISHNLPHPARTGFNPWQKVSGKPSTLHQHHQQGDGKVNWEGQLGRSTEVNWEELNNHNEPNEGRRVRAVRAKSCTKQRALDPKMTKDDDPDVMVTAYNKAILS